MEILPVLKIGKLIVLYGPGAAVMESMALAAELSMRGEVMIFDGGNCYKPNYVATLLRRKTVDSISAGNRLISWRGFTCYEMNALLTSTPPQPHPHLILDLLNTFYDDHVPIYEANRLLKSCLDHIQRLTISAPVVLTLAPPLVSERMFLLDQVCRKADEIFVREEPVSQPIQPSLF